MTNDTLPHRPIPLRSTPRRAARRPVKVAIGLTLAAALAVSGAAVSSADPSRAPSTACETSTGVYSPGCRMTPGQADGWHLASQQGQPANDVGLPADVRIR